MKKIFIIFILAILLFSTEFIVDGKSALDQNEYKKAIKEYINKKYPKKVKKYKEYKVYLRSLIDIDNMIYIKPGSFIMGSNSGGNDEKPKHKITIKKGFYIGKYEVTFKEYDKFCEDVHESKPDDEGWGRGDRPVVNISWNDAKAYTEWLSEKTGKKFRLPTEAEWEYVARAGTNTKWSFGDSSNLDDYAWYVSNSNHKTHKIGLKKPNPWGVYDIYGNVWEWCEDWYIDSYNNTPKDGSPNNNGVQNYKVIRSGSWDNSVYYTRSASRYGGDPDDIYDNVGFRLLQEL